MVPFVCKVVLFVMFYGCLFFLNKALDKVYTYKLRNVGPCKFKKTDKTLPLFHLV